MRVIGKNVLNVVMASNGYDYFFIFYKLLIKSLFTIIMEKVIQYLVENSPWTREELVELEAEQLTSLAYSYGYPNAPAPTPVTK